MNPNENVLSAFETSDFYLACFLYAKDFKILNLKHDDKRVVFIFEDDPKRDELTLCFYNGKGTIDALEYVNAIKNLKAMIFNYQKNSQGRR